MKLFLHGFLVTTSLLAITVQARVRYDGHKLIQVRARSARQVAFLQQLEQDVSLGIDFWRQPNTHLPVDIRVPPGSMGAVTRLLTKAGLRHKVLVDNVQSLVDVEMNSNMHGKRDLNTKGGFHNRAAYSSKNIVGTYPRFNDISSWLKAMSRKYKSFASLHYVGKTYEGRTMTAIQIGRERSYKPIIYIDAGIHAREWISTATAIYIINQMLTKYGSDKNVTRMVDKYTWYILPSANPDGYEYSHVSDRMWRKTRSYNFGSKCRGADPNRNFDFHWGGPSTSSNPCTDIFKGQYPFSERETRNLRNFIRTIGYRTRMYLSLHAYSELWLTPWSYTARRPSDYKDIDRVAKAGANALYKVNGVKFMVSTPIAILYAVGGSSYDWVKAEGGVKYSYTLELRPSIDASKGFIIPTSNIAPSGKEVWAGIMAAVDESSRRT